MAHDNLLHKLKVKSSKRETPDSVSLQLEPLDWQPTARAGQFITIVFETPFGPKRRSYSLSSSPELGEPLTITVKKIDNGEFSRPLNYEAWEGKILLCTGIHGKFVLPEKIGTDQFVFIAAGSGIVPCFSMIKVLLQKHNNRVSLIYSSRSAGQTIFLEELNALKAKFKERFSFDHVLGTNRDITRRRLSKWLLADILNRVVKNEIASSYYLCGPFEFMQMCRVTLLTRTSQKQIFSERYDSYLPADLPAPPDKEPRLVTIRIKGNIFHIHVKYPDSVTKAAAKQGISLPYSCESGKCASCIASVVKGQMWMAYNQVLTDREIQSGRILSCQAFPIHGDAEISFD